tara:strand:- start:453 stop:692 length:240 start_codon:yes stop_codon:yes gene_type:complete
MRSAECGWRCAQRVARWLHVLGPHVPDYDDPLTVGLVLGQSLGFDLSSPQGRADALEHAEEWYASQGEQHAADTARERK